MRKCVVSALLLLLADLPALTGQRIVRVRLFWQHPPSVIWATPHGAWLRRCDTCTPTALENATKITAEKVSVSADSISSASVLITGQIHISGNGFPPFEVRDELRLQARDGVLLLTLRMPLEEYVSSVLQGESASFQSDEALKAMAVAARTYALRFGSRHRLEGFDFCDTTHCQDLRLDIDSPRARAAVAATEGELLWFEGRPAATYYHRSCGGEIEDASALEPDLHVPYLSRHHDDYCATTPDEWQSEISKSDLARALGRPVDTLGVVARSDSGRVQRLVIDGRTVAETEFRLAVGRALGWDKLRSDLYEEEDRGDRVEFHGRGVGHGAGLCQRGAENMGERGHSFREILAYYYPGTTLGLNAQGLSWEKLPGESVDILTTDRNDAPILLPAAERALHFASERTGWDFPTRPQVKVYPTLDIYRDATGEPGWIAASTLGSVIRLQPIQMLERTRSLDSTLRHEFLHMLIESHAARNAPLWLREGLAVYLSDVEGVKPAQADADVLERELDSARTEEEMRAAYRACAVAVAHVVQKNGLKAVLSWLEQPHAGRNP
jgi:stage II sporulation protein D